MRYRSIIGSNDPDATPLTWRGGLVLWLGLMALTAFALLASCISNGVDQWPKPCRGGEQGCRLVDRVVVVMSNQAWEGTGWYRTGDLVQPAVTVLVTADRQGCIATDRMAAVARPGEAWTCPSGWRLWRGVR